MRVGEAMRVGCFVFRKQKQEVSPVKLGGGWGGGRGKARPRGPEVGLVLLEGRKSTVMGVPQGPPAACFSIYYCDGVFACGLGL
mgnify:CR=1 FL=1